MKDLQTICQDSMSAYKAMVSSPLEGDDGRPDKTKVSVFLDQVTPILYSDKCASIIRRFSANENLSSIPIVDSNYFPVGLVDRASLLKLFMPDNGFLLNRESIIADVMDHHPVTVDVGATVDDFTQLLRASETTPKLKDFIIVKNGRYLGVGLIHKLLNEIVNRKQRNLFYLAYYDSLTGLPNRLLFQDRLQQACQHANRNADAFGLIFVDLDGFKSINDSHGHQFGDLVLKAAAERLIASLRESDTVARLGGDEFVIIVSHLKESADIDKICNSILENLGQPLQIFDYEFFLAASLGIALCPYHDQTPNGLLLKADTAMYEAKNSTSSRYVVYSPRFSQAPVKRMSLLRNITRALDNDELVLFYQPLVNLANGQVVGAEALLRWQHPEFGVIAPAIFLPIAEETGVIEEIGQWVLREACKQHFNWIENGLPPTQMAINVSEYEFRKNYFCETVLKILQETGIDPCYIQLEPTERMLMTASRTDMDKLLRLKKQGIKICVDDFGKGFSNLDHLRQLQGDSIKIDISIIRNIQAAGANEAIFRSILRLGNNLGLHIVAEGVETKEELDFIKDNFCREAQGNIFARPVPPADFEFWYKQHLSSQADTVGS